jgi:hypothetical protein
MARRFDDTDAEKCLARPVGQFDEAEALLAIEPFALVCRSGLSPRAVSRRPIK